MLYNLNPLLNPDLLHILRSMGHGDQIAIVDANFPADSHAQRLVRLDGANATDVLEAIVSVMPLDTYVEAPLSTMQVVGKPNAIPEIVSEFHHIASNGPGGKINHASVERFAFYEQVKEAYAVVATSESRLYGNVILTKGVIGS